MNIDPTIKRKNLSDELKNHLQFVNIVDVRTSVVGFLLVLYDLPLITGLLSIYKFEFLWIFMPAIVILHLWGIRLLIKNPYSTQFEMLSFIGVLGILASLSFFILAQGISYYVLNISSLLYYFIVNLSIMIASFVLIKNQLNKYSGDPMKNKKKNDQSKYMGLISVSPAIGYLLALFTRDTTILKFVIFLIIIIFLILLYVTIAAKFMHKYRYLKLNSNFVNFQTPPKKDYKKLREKGVEIK